jgi:oligopeptide transport system substrate-binding protein
MKTQGRWLAMMSVLLFSLFSSCGKNAEPPKKAAVFRMNINREPPTMDPRKGSELISSAMHFIMFEGLMRLNPDGSVSCAQAKSVEISDDRKTYIFHLKDTYWSNGTPVTARDFEYSWKKILSPDFPASNAHLLYPIKNAEQVKKGNISLDAVGIHSVDDKTLKVELENPTPYFLDLVAFCVFFPVNAKVDSEKPDWAYNANPSFISNGPFVLKSWKHNDEIVFEKNPQYWESYQILLDQIHVSMIPDENTALHMYENGELDIIGLGISPIPTDALKKFQQMGLLQTQDSPGTTIICFNLNRFPFNNKNIRKAFAYAINRQEIVENLTQLGEEIATSIIPPVLKNKTQIAFFKDHDVASAHEFFKKGCQELGIDPKKFPEIVYSYSTSEANHKLAQALQNQWAKTLGVKIQIQNTEHKVLLDKLGSRNYEIAQSLWVAQYNDQMNILERFKYKNNPKNYPGWENSDYIRLLEQSTCDLTPEDRLKTLELAETLFIEEMPLAPVYHWRTAFMLKPHLTNTEFLPNGAFNYSRICYADKP